MTLVVAQGTFDLVHTGHLHYIEEAASLGDILVVIISRRSNVEHKDTPILPARQRRDLIDAFTVVDEAILGDEEDIFAPIERLQPDVIVLGHDQHHDEADLAAALEGRGIACEVRRATPKTREYEDELLSTGQIVNRIIEREG